MNNTMLYALTVLIWGSTWYAITFQLGEVHPVLSVAYRFMLASAVLFIFLKLSKKRDIPKFTRAQHITIAMQGFYLFSLNYVLFYFGTAHLTSGLVAIIFSTMTLMNIFNQAMFFGIRVRPQVALGSLFGLAGIVMVFWPEVNALTTTSGTMKGIWLCLAASYCASIGNMVSMKNSREGVPVMAANTFGMMYGAGFSIVLAVILGAEITFEPTYGYTLSLIYLAVFGSAIAFGCYLTLMKNIGADKAAYATVLFPLVALAISTVFEGYLWSPLSMIGVALTLFGNVVAMANCERMLHWRRKKSLPQDAA
ncbi:MAG: DMT family transporter [Alcanivorax sp.]